jgi:hypothetical protein
MDPRLQAPATGVFLGLPSGNYADPNYTATPLANESNRILSFINPALNRASNGLISPAPGNFDSASVLVWPPVDPPTIPIAITPIVNLMVAHAGGGAPPVAVNDSAVTAYNTPVTVSVLNNDTGTGSLAVSALGMAAHGTVTTNGITVVFTPTPGFVGNDSFNYTVSGIGGTATAKVDVTINAQVNFAPVQR